MPRTAALQTDRRSCFSPRLLSAIVRFSQEHRYGPLAFVRAALSRPGFWPNRTAAIAEYSRILRGRHIMIGQLRRSLTLVVVVAIAAYLTFSTPINGASGLADAYRIIAGKQFIDLTHSFGPDSPVWSGFGQAR